MIIPQIKLVCRPRSRPSRRKEIVRIEDAVQLLRKQWDPETLGFLEESKLLCLHYTTVIGIYNLCAGAGAPVALDARLVFMAALKAGANRIILAQNRPNNIPAPTEADAELTEKLREAGELLNIVLSDHLILTVDGHYSFWDNGRLKIMGHTKKVE